MKLLANVCYIKRNRCRLQRVFQRASPTRVINDIEPSCSHSEPVPTDLPIVDGATPIVIIMQYTILKPRMGMSTSHDGIQKSTGTRSEVLVLSRNDPSFQMVEKTFDDGWIHPDKPKPYIRAIFEIRLPQEMLDTFDQYKMRVASSLAVRKHSDRSIEKILFHGTNRYCFLGENKDRTRLCRLPECFLCAIIDSSFDISKCGGKNKFRRFGTGIYSTSCSSSNVSFSSNLYRDIERSVLEADDYVANAAANAIYRVMLASRVIVGRPYRRLKNGTKLMGPPPGYHSIIGETGIDLNYPETVVYDNDAIRPAFLVVYGFLPEKPANKFWHTALKLFKTPVAS